jgi:hypothetical protein
MTLNIHFNLEKIAMRPLTSIALALRAVNGRGAFAAEDSPTQAYGLVIGSAFTIPQLRRMLWLPVSVPP